MPPPPIMLRDEQAGSFAEISSTIGMNCFRFGGWIDGQHVEWLWSDPQFISGTVRPSRSGIPILFPHPGRVAGSRFEWDGKQYQLEPTDPQGNSLHGFVHTRPWRIVDEQPSSVRGEFCGSIDDPALLDRWPGDWRLTVEHSLAGNTLRVKLTVENIGNESLPFSLGLHPYLRVPQGGASADDCVVTIPVSQRWQLENMLPTGEKQPLANAAQLQQGQHFGNLTLDDPFSGLIAAADGRYSASVADPASKRRLTMRFDSAFREIVAFTPPHREAIAIEPYTAAPDAIHLQQRGVDAGLRVLEPGERFIATVEFIGE